MEAAEISEPLWNAQMISDYLDVDPSTLSNWKKKGFFPPGLNMGGGWVRWPKSVIEEFIKKHEDETTKS